MIPVVEDLKSASLIHKVGDVYNPPGLTNFLGTVQAGMDPTAFVNLNSPPFSMGPCQSGSLFLDGTLFSAYGTRVTTTWFPHKIVRRAAHNGLVIETTTVLPEGVTGVWERIEVTNTGGFVREVNLGLGLNARVIRKDRGWTEALVPGAERNRVTVDPHLKTAVFASPEENAFMVQGTFPRPDTVNKRRLECRLSIGAGKTETVHLTSVIGPDREEVCRVFAGLVSRGEDVITDAEKFWNDELKAVFTPGNDRYSGSLPELCTTNEDILRLYFAGILGVVYFKRDNPYSVYGRSYDTLMPLYWQSVTFLWDYSLSSLVHALLDPGVMKRYLEDWMRTDIHSHFGTEYLTGGSVGPWYAVNDYAMSRMASDYLRWSGDFDWLEDTPAGSPSGSGKTILSYLEDYAGYWKRRRLGHGLADYGNINNLLECVSSYIHQVASLNAGNVFNMRFLADLLDMKNLNGAHSWRGEADELVHNIHSLYENGGGYWNVRHMNGELVEVRHCYDFITILSTIPDDLSDTQKREMVDFFLRELKTDSWMRALSPRDPDAPFSLRPDHQWNGAYPAWPAQAVAGLYRIGRGDVAFEWLKGLSRSANQGPFGQAHFTEDYIGTEAGGAPKASYDIPYLCDWSVSSGGSWANVIIESIFGIRTDLSGEISARPQFAGLEKEACLKNIPFRGKLYTADRNGIRS